MTKLKALTAYLIERRLVLPEQLDSYADQVSLELVWKPGVDGMHLGDMRYRAVISMERFADHPSRLMALVGSWLENHDKNRKLHDLPSPQFAIEMPDDDLADVDLTLEFVEPQYLSEDPAGEIEAFDKTWSFIPFDLWVAEHGEVSSHGA